MAAGVGGNVLVGVVCLLGLLVLVGSLSPIVSGVYVSSVTEDPPAVEAGLMARDVLVSIDNITINNSNDLRTVLDTYSAGDNVTVTVRRGDGWQDMYTTNLTLATSENRTVMGVMVYNLQTQEVLNNYNQFSPKPLTIPNSAHLSLKLCTLLRPTVPILHKPHRPKLVDNCKPALLGMVCQL
jgi:membrane-associated protease RseP (regulator of RpoE activity)